MSQNDKKDFRCRKCGHPTGVSNGKYLWVGNCKFYRVVSFYCTNCGHENRWRPYPTERNVVK